MQKVKINYTNENSVAQIILDDGKGNVLDSVMMSELQELLDSFRSQSDIKLITLEGAGKHFSYGASVKEHQKECVAQMLASFHRLFYTMIEISIPMLAKVSGQCLGGGMELTLMCNVIFADKTANLGQPEITLGVFAPPASLLLPLKIGAARAEELLITGKIITADEAKALGIVNVVFDTKEAMEHAVDEWIQKHILPKSAPSLRSAVKASRTFQNHILTKFLPMLEQMYLHELMETCDANEGIRSFLEKRKPVWSNR